MPRKSRAQAARTAYANVLGIHSLNVDVNLGAEKKERSKKQKIIIDVRFYLPTAMSSAVNDNGAYICYHEISEKIHALCVKKEYRLIEYLVSEVYRLIRKQTPKAVKIWVRLQKPRILLGYVGGGSSVTTTDLPPFSWVVPD